MLSCIQRFKQLSNQRIFLCNLIPVTNVYYTLAEVRSCRFSKEGYFSSGHCEFSWRLWNTFASLYNTRLNQFPDRQQAQGGGCCYLPGWCAKYKYKYKYKYKCKYKYFQTRRHIVRLLLSSWVVRREDDTTQLGSYHTSTSTWPESECVCTYLWLFNYVAIYLPTSHMENSRW